MAFAKYARSATQCKNIAYATWMAWWIMTVAMLYAWLYCVCLANQYFLN